MSGRTTFPDGHVEFDCTECKMHVMCAVDDGFDFPVCAMCRWLGERPWLDEAAKARIRAGGVLAGGGHA